MSRLFMCLFYLRFMIQYLSNRELICLSIRRWLENNVHSLCGKTVAVTGSTGGIGVELCKYLAQLGANLILIDRNHEKSQKHRTELLDNFNVFIECITADLEDFSSVKTATQFLKEKKIDIFIHNAGAYSIPRKICDSGFDNVFQINFISPYYMIRQLIANTCLTNGRVVIVGSIAHNYSKIDDSDIDFSTRKQASLVYGNAKRYLMFSLYELFKNEQDVSLSVTHPGITFTNITAHYPKLIFAVIKHPMKVIFMRPKKAALSILKGCFEATDYHRWIGPYVFNIWGFPQNKKLSTVSKAESEKISKIAEEIYQKLINEGK